MDLAALVLALGPRNRDRARRQRAAALAALEAGFEPTVVVITDVTLAASMPEGAVVLLDDALEASESSAMRVGIDWCARAGAAGVVLAVETRQKGAPSTGQSACWVRLAHAQGTPLTVGISDGVFSGLVRIDAHAFALLPISGPATALWERHPEIVTELVLDEVTDNQTNGSSVALDDAEESASDVGAGADFANQADIEAVTKLLGRSPSSKFRVVVRNLAGEPVVIENEPFLDDGTPMPTRYWLVGKTEREAVGRLEANGGVHLAEESIGEEVLADTHRRYEALRDAAIDPAHEGPRPYGGVGGTRRGVKCLHAHLAWYLAGGDDPVGRFVVRQLAGVLEGPVAAIDCGTNSTRLLIVDRNGATLARRMTITRLGEGVDHTGQLADAAIDRTIAALIEYEALIATHGVVRVRATATAAARDASNANVFFDRAAAVIGVRPELITGEEEGRLTYQGATADLKADAPVLVLDIGGGSTELVAGPLDDAGLPSVVVSLPMGCVRITERFLASDPPTTEELAAARSFVGEQVEAALTKLPGLKGPRQVIGVAGTVSALATQVLGLADYDRDAIHHQVLTAANAERLLSELSAETVAVRRARPGMEHDRADVIVGGTVILAEVLARLGFAELICSESDILDGLAASLLKRPDRTASTPTAS